MSYSVGDFVFCLFPEGGQYSDLPSERPHTVYVLAVQDGWAIVVYTTTTFVPPAGTNVVGVRDFSDQEAANLGQRKAFRFDARTMAKLPLNGRFFPFIANPNDPNHRHGQPAGTRLQKALEGIATKALEHKLVDMRGP